ncbi:RHS repeat domain-containing protein [Pseudomonas syringae]|uniref:RHS repeat domain-containing protein n=1 Tax=Pseudomonas syringae TaxID=317 RepID=UPI003F765DA9
MPTPTVHSNAFNFLSFVQAGVDPRTGQYSCSISLPELKANHLCGPIVPLSLGFSPMNSRDTGFGKGWGLQLSHFDPVTSILSLSTGETFRIDGPQSAPTVPERKIDSFHFSFEADDQYRVVHKSGLVEILGKILGSDAAWVTQMHSAEGHRVDLSYTLYGGEALLQQISDDYGTLLSVERNGTTSTAVHLHPDKGPNGTPLASFNLSLNNGELVSIALPTTNQASWRFVYELFNEYLCITELRTPLGGHELISYDPQGHQFPQNHYPSLPRVERHEQRPGFSQPAVERRFSYSSENFLGFDASGLVWDEDGLDNLYQADPAYTYSSTEMLWVQDQALRSTTRTFNNFHLLTEETVTQNDNVLTTQTTYHSTPGLPFLQQPAQCQLPDAVLKIWYHPSTSSQTHEETTRTTFDEFGNLLTQENPDGTLETSRYYPAAGGDGCPPDPHGFVRNLQDKTITPAPDALGEAPVLRSAYRYALQTGVGAGSTPDWLAISGETLLQVQGASETELQRTTFTYIDEPANRYLHGRKLQETQTLNGQSSITDYAYQRTKGARAEESVQHTVISLSTNFDDVQKSYTLEHSLLNGQPLLNRDDNDVEIAYRYDALGRVTEETVAPGSDEFKAVRKYDYVLSASDGQQAEQTVTNVKGIKTRTLMDGNNRVIEELRQGADESQPEAYKKIYSASYDVRGLLVADTVSDWLLIDATLRELPLTSTYQYDDWGEQYSVTGPDKVTQVTQSNPILKTVRSWVQSSDATPLISGMSEVKTNTFGKSEWSKALDASGSMVSQIDYVYDGLGRCIQEIDPMRQSTLFSYDARSRLVKTTLPDRTVVEKDYAGHSTEALPISIRVKAADAPDATLLGEQSYDGLDRQTHIKVGPRTTRYLYDGGQMQIDRLITPGNRTIHYEYQLGLTDQPVRTIADDEQADFTYDSATASMSSSQNSHSRSEFDYDLFGQLKRERRIESGQTWETVFSTSMGGRQLGRQDASGLKTAYEYDPQGRVKSVKQGQLQADFDYSSLGQLNWTITTDLSRGHTLKTTVGYDDQGREIERTVELQGHETHRISQTWRSDGKLLTRHLQAEERSLLDERFEYDIRGRLSVHTCGGDCLPQDRYGNPIQQQCFYFDALDNITKVSSTFVDSSTDEATFYFASGDPGDPTQLQRIDHTHIAYPPSVSLKYDLEGNLVRDENAQQLAYDSQSRLLSVTTVEDVAAGQYRYDAHNHLVAVQQAEQQETLRFYQGERLATLVQGSETTSFLYDGSNPLGQQVAGDDLQTLLFMSDAKQSILAESQAEQLRTAVYSAYGERNPDSDLRSLLGFNGEVRDEISGWYLLGRGYRAYNPTLMRFHSPDSLSPFGAGGLNPYVYCLGDPIGLVDPTGHMSRGLFLGLNIAGLVLGIIGTVATGGLVAPALSAQFAAFAVAQTAGVAAVVTGGIGIYTPDLQAKKVLGGISTALGIVSLLAGVATIATGSSKWFGKGAGAVDAPGTPKPPFKNPLANLSSSEVGSSSSNWRLGPPNLINSESENINMSLFQYPKTVNHVASQTPHTPPRSPVSARSAVTPPSSQVPASPPSFTPPPPPPPPPPKSYSSSLPASGRAAVSSSSVPKQLTQTAAADDEFLRLINASNGKALPTGKVIIAGDEVVKNLNAIRNAS